MISEAKEESNYNISFRTPGFIIACSFQKAYVSKKTSNYWFSPPKLCTVEFLNISFSSRMLQAPSSALQLLL